MPRAVLQTAAEKNAEIMARRADLNERAQRTFFGWDSSEYSRVYFEHGSAYVNILNFDLQPIDSGSVNLTYQYDET